MKDTPKEEKKQTGRSKLGKGLRKAAGLTLLTGACAGTGLVLGAAAHFYKYSLTPKKHDPRLDSDPSEKEYAAGRKWVKNHPLREEGNICLPRRQEITRARTRNMWDR